MIARETPVTVMSGGMRMVGMLHCPDASAAPPAVVFYHGMTGSRAETHWLFVKLSRHLAAHGIMSLRFDFRGSGESEGGFEDMTISDELSDGVRAFEYLERECGADPLRIGILGLSMGGAVAAVTAGRLGKRVRSCVLLNPVADPVEDIAVIGRSRDVVMSGYPVEYNSFLFGEAFFRDLPSIRPIDEIARALCPVLVVNGTADATISPARSSEYMDALRNHGVPSELYVIEGANHSFSSRAWHCAVMEKVGDWFGRTLT
jgi:uncharacterized protein